MILFLLPFWRLSNMLIDRPTGLLRRWFARRNSQFGLGAGSPVYCGESMFHSLLGNSAELVRIAGEKCQTRLRSRNLIAFWPIVAKMIVFSYLGDHSKWKPLNHVRSQWLPRSRTPQLGNQKVHRNFCLWDLMEIGWTILSPLKLRVKLT